MSIISTIDCTFGDGGYTNNWQFDYKFQVEAVKALIQSGIEVIECGFISEKSGNDNFGTYFKSVEKADEFLKTNGFNNSCSKFSAIIRPDEYNPDNLPKCEKAENCITNIRVMVNINEISDTVEFINKIAEKGYDVHIYPMVISCCDDEAIVKMLDCLKTVNYKSIVIADIFGSLDESEIKKLTILFDKYTNRNSSLSIHCSNNLAKAYQNTNAFIASVSANRDVYLYSSINGLGRGAGNLASEILISKLKTEKNTNYSVLPLSKFCNNYMNNFKRIISEKDFYVYALTAKKNMHPNYGTHLILNNFEKKHIFKILDLILPEKYENFDYEYIKSLCGIYMIKYN